jgi:hypothetical protein
MIDLDNLSDIWTTIVGELCPSILPSPSSFPYGYRYFSDGRWNSYDSVTSSTSFDPSVTCVIPFAADGTTLDPIYRSESYTARRWAIKPYDADSLLDEAVFLFDDGSAGIFSANDNQEPDEAMVAWTTISLLVKESVAKRAIR